MFAIVGGVLSLIGMISQKASQSNGWKKLSYFLIAIGGILTIVSATGTTIRQSAQADESRKKSNELLSISRLLQVRSDELLEQSKRINILTETVAKRNYEISQKNSRITELVQESLSWTTGGENFCYFQFPHPNPKSNTIDLVLRTSGKHPVYDVSIKITDNEALNAALYSKEREGMPPLESQIDIMNLLASGSKIINLGTMAPQIVYPISKIKLPDTDKQSYQINIWARNGHAVQLLSYRRVNGIWKGAMRTYKRDNTYKEDIEPGFPQNEKGEAIW
ncbi:hypothetical protein EG832_17005 [bacterium]|nr:hypothetical protein [bacterium]